MPHAMRVVALLICCARAASGRGCGLPPSVEVARTPQPAQQASAAEAPLPKMRPRVVQPRGRRSPRPRRRRPAASSPVAPIDDGADLPAPTGPASAGAAQAERA